MKEHEKDQEKIKNLIQKFEIDLIVVGANKLEARNIKKVLSSIAASLKSFGSKEDKVDDKKGSGNKEEENKEALVIWGSLDIPKLFANSPMSNKLIKGADHTLK